MSSQRQRLCLLSRPAAGLFLRRHRYEYRLHPDEATCEKVSMPDHSHPHCRDTCLADPLAKYLNPSLSFLSNRCLKLPCLPDFPVDARRFNGKSPDRTFGNDDAVQRGHRCKRQLRENSVIIFVKVKRADDRIPFKSIGTLRAVHRARPFPSEQPLDAGAVESSNCTERLRAWTLGCAGCDAQQCRRSDADTFCCRVHTTWGLLFNQCCYALGN